MGEAQSGNLVGSLKLEIGGIHLVPTYACVQVETDVGWAVAMERIAVHAAALGCRQFHGHIGIVQVHPVVAGADGLVLVAEHCGVLFHRAYRQQADVAQVANARTAEVGMAEAHQHIVAVVVARAPVPAAGVLRWPQLDKAERHVGTQEHMAMAACANARIDQFGEIARRGKQGQQGHEHGQAAQGYLFHEWKQF